MIVYNCPLLPFEFFHALRIPSKRIEPSSTEFQKLHPNVCAFCRSAVCSVEPTDVLVWTDSCDSMRRAYDFLSQNVSFYLHVPVNNDELAVQSFARDLKKLWEFLKTVFNREVPLSELERVHRWFIEKSIQLERLIDEDLNEAKTIFEELSNEEWVGSVARNGRSVLLLGSWANNELVRIVEKAGGFAVNATCSGPYGLIFEAEPVRDVFESIARRILNRKLPCGRFAAGRRLESLIERFRPDAIVLHTAKFCDFYHFDEETLRKLKIPFVTIENDFTNALEQARTRIEALLEGTKDRVRPSFKVSYFVGIDSGSTSTKIVVLNERGEILFEQVSKTGADPKESAKRLMNQAMKHLNFDLQKSFIVATGYGRDAIDFAHERVTELTCHAVGVKHLYPDVRTIIDVGGQDSKVMRIENGKIVDFVMNDKCAAGTGRFLEIVSSILETPLQVMGKESLKAKTQLNISSVCAVFAESEIISLRSKGYSKQEILWAAHHAIARRLVTMYERVKGSPLVVLTGGVALNEGLKRALEELLEVEIIVPKNPVTTGALGAALMKLQQKL
ncbi:acyl-CoA dehydratase activase [Pseudothermotoga sp.]